jgi:recombination protein RecA
MTLFPELMKDLRKKKFDVSLLADDDSPCLVNEWVSTGCMALDKIIGSGVPVGRMIEIYGGESSGKSLIAAQIAAMAQQEGHVVAYVDTESAVSIDIMRAVGVDVDSLIYASPDTVEEVFKFFQACIDAKALYYNDKILVLIWDSVAATSSQAEMMKEYGEVGYLTHARIISQSLRKMMREISKQRVVAVFLNQLKEKLGVMFGDKDATFGGAAVKFHASVRVRLTTESKIKTARKKVVGVNVRARVVKNKVAYPFQEAVLPIHFGEGIDDCAATLYWMVDNEYIIKAGRYYTWGEERFERREWDNIYVKSQDAIADLMFKESEAGEIVDDEEPEGMDGDEV